MWFIFLQYLPWRTTRKVEAVVSGSSVLQTRDAVVTTESHSRDGEVEGNAKCIFEKESALPAFEKFPLLEKQNEYFNKDKEGPDGWA